MPDLALADGCLPSSLLCHKKNHRQLQWNDRMEGSDDSLKNSNETEVLGQKERNGSVCR